MSNPNLTNTTTNNHVLEEEWEQIDSKLNTLQLEQPTKPTPNIIQRSSPIPPPPTMRIPPETIEPEAIDTALLSAFENQRERMILFQLEDMILQFVKSTERAMEVPSGLNSYRRLLIYRLSERFGLIHSTSDYPNEAGEKIIYLNRTENTYIPTVLLIDLKPKESVENIRMNDESNSPNSPGNMSATSSDQSTSQKKVFVMKRHPNHHRNLNTKSNVKNQITVEEKEKAYNEARARIFGESNPGIEANTLVNDSKEPLNPATTPSTSVDPSLNQSTRMDLPTQTTDIRPLASETTNAQPSLQQMPSHTSHNKHKPVNVSTWKEKKGQIRNIESEKYDPDFVRRSNVQPVAVNNNMFVSNPTGYPQSYRQQMPPQQMNYQPYPMMQGQPMPGNWVYPPNPYAAYDPYSMQQQGYYGEMQPPQAYYPQQAYATGPTPPQPPSNGSNPPNRSFQQDFPPLS